MNEIVKVLMNHRSVREFNEKKVSDEIKNSIIQCAQMAPTSSYFQAYSIINVTSPQKKAVLAASSGGQTCVEKAPLALLFCADLHRNQKYLVTDDKDILHNTEAYTVSVVDASLAAQKAFIAAQSYGLGGVTVGGVRNDMELMKKEFGLPDMVVPLFLLCLGYYDEEPPQRPRLPQRVVLKEDYYNEDNNDKLIEQYNEQVREFYRKNTNGARQYSWIEYCSHTLSVKPRHEVTDFVKNAGLLKK